uniref:uncharacterized protein LOC124073031 isoform X2 n=1 Tax=Scatophagus argus TaxID=75038 RepID=UPI001ED7D658|nr:uncharacterized protein LOC124073031 isoform X2 [Scatophagus argus]
MSATWLKLITIFCLSCGSESGGVVYRNIGESLTIQCRSNETDEEFLHLKRGLNEDDVLVKEHNLEPKAISKEFTGRLQLNGKFPNIDILIKNVTLQDLGPFWCMYSKFVKKTSEYKMNKRSGSVLLVVTDTTDTTSTTVKGHGKCETGHNDLILGSIVISAVVLLGVVMIFFIWIIKKSLRSTAKPRSVPTNDVYEDMRGTLKR